MQFTSPPDPAQFNHRVWDIVRRIPAGRVASYGQVARLIPIPQGVEEKDYRAYAPRWVGSAMAQSPDDVPWWRVLNSQGEISLRSGAEKQRKLLEAEGVEFNPKGRVDMARFGWQNAGD
jgi:methylated-DNA-protein-cysteine methyltransferase related protein